MNPDVLIGLGDHPVLDFVNSLAFSADGPIELIADGWSYLRWLQLTGLVGTAEREALPARFGSEELDRIAVAAVELREWLRPRIGAWAGGSSTVPDEPTLSRLNGLLATD
ncbi:hypothetical protein CcI156_11735 [Frankia sp. CcI156]|jgi:hypothetical protein|uniref:Uncharacterized protein n=1 Tax=Frankia casuarinae (strain DSM 45818 / CECT 9043 / HFP020203 / CcI3) TaxID=106370 RepID=Q2JG21_FRACC|nr:MULTISPECIES: ABATE domain-containing protein [Frankia]OFB43114.1 hypothetical protein Manayef4_12665 [Frankia sp. CgIM4]ONH26082.1 hypothetical protein CcI156_11735 [Frankia sp. CcI156]ORT47470.1 hypothetical protein KBI5_19540 [Frankia sp. KB5]ABD09771.1 conserved hypothetical protein [Frankia casuarinae]ETA02248.1 hypothetical protein CcI6DRAFT_02236 [Frankia sp. CcI6]